MSYYCYNKLTEVWKVMQQNHTPATQGAGAAAYRRHRHYWLTKQSLLITWNKRPRATCSDTAASIPWPETEQQYMWCKIITVKRKLRSRSYYPWKRYICRFMTMLFHLKCIKSCHWAQLLPMELDASPAKKKKYNRYHWAQLPHREAVW